jgi:hypothetical protein
VTDVNDRHRFRRFLAARAEALAYAALGCGLFWSMWERSGGFAFFPR